MIEHYLTVGQLLERIKHYNVSEDTKICYQRIEDSYFDGQDISGMRGSEASGAVNGIFPPGFKTDGWNTVKTKGDKYYNAVDFNKELEYAQLVREGKFDPDDVAPYYMREDLKPIDLDREDLLDQYIEAFECWYDKEQNVFCITAHY